MSTPFEKSPLPLWVFIILIVVAFLIGLCTVAVIARCWVIRNKSQQEDAPDLQPMRRVTVRRGRVVPASHYLSLTGSRFGLKQFEDPDFGKSGRRSKSPFEWFNSISEKKHVPQHGSSVDFGSGRSRANSFASALYGRRDLSGSNYSLVSEKEAMPSVQEVAEPVAAPAAAVVWPVRNTSFSRPFVPRTPTTPLTHVRNLSRIEEASPHNSVISTRSAKKPSSRASNPNTVDGQPATTTQGRPSASSAIRKSGASGMSSMSSPQPSPRHTHIPEIPRAVAYAGSRSSLGESEQGRTSLSNKSSFISQHESVHERTEAPYMTSIPPGDQSHNYWQSRMDLQPIAHSVSNSKKGNVLRKKSFRQAQIISMVDA